MNKKKDTLNIIIFSLIGVVLLGFLGYKVKNDFFTNTKEEKTVSTIGLYGYTLSNKDTDIYKKYYKDLEKVLSNKEIDYKEYANLITKLFIIDTYSLNTKLASTDIGGLDFIHEDLKESYTEYMQSNLYKTVESNINGDRTQELPEVKDVTIVSNDETTYTYNKKEYKAYSVKANIEYVKNLSYQKELTVTLIEDNNILYIVKTN